MSIRARLILQLTVLVAGLWLATAAISRYVFVREIDEVVSASLSESAIRLMPMVTHMVLGDAQEAGRDRDGDEPREIAEETYFLQSAPTGFLAFEARDADGSVVLRSHDASEYRFPEAGRDGYLHDGNLYAYTVSNPASGLSLTVVETDAHRNEAIREATLAMLVPLLLLIPLMVGAILFLTRNVMAPVHDLRRQIAARGGDNFSPIEAAEHPAELQPIARAVDRLLERLQRAMDAERSFAANSAHELRTPLAGALAQTQRLKDEIGTGPGHRRVAEIEATLKHLSDFTAKLLQLSRVEAGLGMQSARENMSPVIDLVLRDVRASLGASRRIVVDNRLGQDLMVAMDRDAFAICLRNLLENALLHGNSDDPVRVVMDPDWSVHVINAGPVVPADQLAALTRRFTRGETMAGGSGLGLAIVDRIMRQSGGQLLLHSPALHAEDGFEAVLQLP